MNQNHRLPLITEVQIRMTKEVLEAIKKALNVTIVVFAIGIIVGQAIRNFEQEIIIEELETELSEIQEQLHISNDQLKMIEMRNEAEKYIEEEVGGEVNE